MTVHPNEAEFELVAYCRDYGGPMAKRSVHQRVMDALQGLDGQGSAADIAAQLPDANIGTIRATMSRAAADGILIKLSRGIYAIPTAARTPPAKSPAITSSPRAGRTDPSWAVAAATVLREAGRAMHYREISEAIIEAGLRKKVGQKPSAVVNSILAAEIAKNASKSKFLRTEPGVFMLRELLDMVPNGDDTAPSNNPSADRRKDEEDTDVIDAFGMYWRRDWINWAKSSPPLLGAETAGADPIDIGGGRGVYLLHDRTRTVYVGRVVDQPLAKRLRQHTRDRLVGRWDRFSWFVLPTSASNDFAQAAVIAALEAVLIEAMEPPLNRKRGDRMTEMIQQEDPALKQRRAERQQQALLARVFASMEQTTER